MAIKPMTNKLDGLDSETIMAIEMEFSKYKFMSKPIEIHLPSQSAENIMSTKKLVVWPKYSSSPVCFLIQHPLFSRPIYYDRSAHKGYYLSIIMSPVSKITVYLANMNLKEQLLQVEDIIIHNEIPLWETMPFMKRWDKIIQLFETIPAQPGNIPYTFAPVKPISLANWPTVYDSTLSWIIQPDTPQSQRYYWWDRTIQSHQHQQSHQQSHQHQHQQSTKFKQINSAEYQQQQQYLLNQRNNEGLFVLAIKQNDSPDTYMLFSSDGDSIGYGCVQTMQISKLLNENSAKYEKGFNVEVRWNTEFKKYEIMKLIPNDIPISPSSFFRKDD